MSSEKEKEVLEDVIGQLLRAKGWRISIAESCTGGLISHRITNIYCRVMYRRVDLPQDYKCSREF